MALSDTKSMALFCDFENVALGVRESNYQQFDISKVLERLLLKGSIVVKKAYCDWQRYKEFKAAMHQASFELIEIPHVRQSGKNSADIRMVVDALDLCYTKSHVDTFVIISGDSDFSPLVSKLRENNKTVIGVGVKNSTSDLLIANCDEFIYYDDLVRDEKPARTSRRRVGERAAERGGDRGAEKAPERALEKAAERGAEKTPERAPEKAGGRAVARKAGSSAAQAASRDEAKVAEGVEAAAVEKPVRRRRSSKKAALEQAFAEQAAVEPADAVAAQVPEARPGAAADAAAEPASASGADEPGEERTQQALELVVGTIEALAAERGDDEKIWGSMVKQTLKRRRPGFNESYYGFRSFNRLLEEARDRGLIDLELDDKSGGYTVRSLV